ncbi:GspH/FimT family pseudopilin [Pseudomonas subflava]|uniref:GspH/FimT family pseudopilin n=1 Tax=Pseudomonas subflava TaxID=2952933 RepID=UPI0020797CD9|nr:GspH/FimT family pseudopilin [Pseudomonas subflava]
MDNFRQRAVTLPELLSVVALLALMNTYALPSFSQWVTKNEQQSLQESLLHHLRTARSKAVLQERTLEICASTDGLRCIGEWNKGWILRVAKTEEVLAVEQLSLKDSALHWHGYRERILFRRDGQTPLSNGRFYLCHGNKVAWQLIISRQGLARRGSDKENQAAAYRCI